MSDDLKDACSDEGSTVVPPGVHDVVHWPSLDDEGRALFGRAESSTADSAAVAGPAEGLAGSASVGSAAHHLGLCKPCDFVHRNSCRMGASCKFCHLCGPEANKQRKKQRQAYMRTLKKWQQDTVTLGGTFALKMRL